MVRQETAQALGMEKKEEVIQKTHSERLVESAELRDFSRSTGTLKQSFKCEHRTTVSHLGRNKGKKQQDLEEFSLSSGTAVWLQIVFHNFLHFFSLSGCQVNSQQLQLCHLWKQY